MSVRFAVIGVGDVAQRDYLPEFHRLGSRASLVVACSKSTERAHHVAAEFGFERWTTNFAEAAAAEDVDAVINLTPLQLHLDVTLAALAAGKHVYTEKPVASTSEDARLIDAESARRDRRVVAAPSVMLFPQVRRAAEIVRSGDLGVLHSARGSAFGGVPPWEGYMSNPKPFFAPGGGPLVDMAVYPLHAITGLLGPVKRVSAFSKRTRTSFTDPLSNRAVPVDVDDNWHLVIELESGILASVEANNSAAMSAGPELELLGELATLGVSLLDGSQPVQTFTYDGVQEEAVPHDRASGPDHILGVEHLVACIETGSQPTLNVAHAAHVLAIVEGARTSASEGRAVPVENPLSWTSGDPVGAEATV